jgi:hypothetical protein
MYIFPLVRASTVEDTLFIFDIQDFVWLTSGEDEYISNARALQTESKIRNSDFSKTILTTSIYF